MREIYKAEKWANLEDDFLFSDSLSLWQQKGDWKVEI